MTQATEQIASQFANGAGNSRVWGDLIVNVKVFGAKGDGTTDDAAAIQAALTSLTSGGTLRFPTGTYKITSTLNVPSNVIVEGAGEGTVIKLNTGDISGFLISTQSNVAVRDLKILCQVVGTAGYTAGVKIVDSEKCLVENVTFEGMSWAGVYLSTSSKCQVTRCRFSGWLGTLFDSADISIQLNSNYNIISYNHCFGGGYYGVIIQDPYVDTLPSKNVVDHNVIGVHEAYGVAVYMPYAGDSYNKVSNNYIEDIKGGPVSGNTGSGIYIVGIGAGGTSVIGNTIKNCNTQTTGRTNAPGAIGVSGLSAINAGVVVADNNISDVQRYDGILSVSNEGAPIQITGNTIMMPAGNTTGEPIVIENSQNTSVVGNSIIRATDAGRGLKVRANNKLNKNINISDNQVIGGASNQIEFEILDTGSFKYVTVNGNKVTGGVVGTISLYFRGVDTGIVSGNVCESVSNYAAIFQECNKVRVSGNSLTTQSGSVSVGLSGAGSANFFDKSNGINGFVENTAAGFRCEQFLSAAPVSPSSFAAAGDRVENVNAIVGQPKGWRCTVAGNPGTWVSEGNL